MKQTTLWIAACVACIAIGFVSGFLLKSGTRSAIDPGWVAWEDLGMRTLVFANGSGGLSTEMYVDDDDTLITVQVDTNRARWEFTIDPDSGTPRLALTTKSQAFPEIAGESTRMIDGEADGLPEFVLDDSLNRIPLEITPSTPE